MNFVSEVALCTCRATLAECVCLIDTSSLFLSPCFLSLCFLTYLLSLHLLSPKSIQGSAMEKGDLDVPLSGIPGNATSVTLSDTPLGLLRAVKSTDEERSHSPFHRNGYVDKPQTTGGFQPSIGRQSPSVLGQHDMPEPAARPKGPKLRFTPEDDALLVHLKETKKLPRHKSGISFLVGVLAHFK
jgi:hypothetical protein